MTVHPYDDWIARSNAETLLHVERQGRTGPGLVPFLGAGLSMPYGFKDWRTLLLDAAPPDALTRVRTSLDRADYEGAAEILLRRLGPEGFQAMVAGAAGDVRLDGSDLTIGTVSMLPLLATGPVVTTNFDRLLERSFSQNGRPFESVISGPRPDLIVDALHGNRRVLIKLHGDWQDRVGRTFARSDYDTNYGKNQRRKKRELLEGAEQLLFSSRSILFIGASLGPDRTVDLLRKVQDNYAGIRHFAIMSAPTTRQAFTRKEAQLRASGIMPLWYQPDSAADHANQVEQVVREILERISVRTVSAAGQRSGQARVLQADRSVPVSSADRADPDIGQLEPHFSRVTRLIEDGRLTFFVGSAIHGPGLLAREFYLELARVFECEALGEDLYAIAQYIADRDGRENLTGEIRKLFAKAELTSHATHRFFVDWPSYRTRDGHPLPAPTVFTTNYDDVLENALDAAGLDFHLLSYQADGPDRGLFYHRLPDDSVRVIERPESIRDLSPGFVVVKLNGGFDRRHRIPENYATTRLDFWYLAARIPELLPAAIRETLTSNPLLFLGHGLAAQDVESLVRAAHRDHPGPRSWAVVLNKNDSVEYWRQCGVEILSHRVDSYIWALRAQLLTQGPP